MGQGICVPLRRFSCDDVRNGDDGWVCYPSELCGEHHLRIEPQATSRMNVGEIVPHRERNQNIKAHLHPQG